MKTLLVIGLFTLASILGGCATKNGSVVLALNIGSRSAAIAGENEETEGVEVAGSGGVEATLPVGL